MGSSRYFQEQELATAEPGVLDGAAAQLSSGQPFSRSQIWSFD